MDTPEGLPEGAFLAGAGYEDGVYKHSVSSYFDLS